MKKKINQKAWVSHCSKLEYQQLRLKRYRLRYRSSNNRLRILRLNQGQFMKIW